MPGDDINTACNPRLALDETMFYDGMFSKQMKKSIILNIILSFDTSELHKRTIHYNQNGQ